jgi:hypothetical protein
MFMKRLIMKFTIEDLNDKLFQAETNLNAIEHPHIYMQWLQVKMSEKLLNEMKSLGVLLQQKP